MVRALLVLLSVWVAAWGQNYGFTVPEFDCRMEVNSDRSISIAYDILFQCESGRHSIDIIDIGFPTDDYDLNSMTASIDGQRLYHIQPSTYIDIGVEVHLSGKAISPGRSGRFEFYGVNTDMVFLDSEKEDYASVEFTPTWFDGSILYGTSDFNLEIVFPPGAAAENVFYHERPFTDSYVDSLGRVVYVWQETRRVDSPYRVGISFPAGLVEGPLSERPRKPLISAAALAVLIPFFVIFLFIVMFVILIVVAVRKSRRRREQYLPPSIGLEGSSVRRGLTAPMAALLLEEKLDRVFLMMIFGLLRKGALQLTGGKLDKTGSTEGLRPYESALLGLIHGKGKIEADGVKKIFLDMIDQLEEKMEGFSLKETREYYRSIIQSAWRMVESDQSAKRVGEMLGDNFLWLLADREFDSRVKDLPQGRTAYLPAYMHGLITGSLSPGKGMSLSKACSQVAGVLESTAGKMVSNISSLSRSVTATSNPVPVSTYRGSSSGSSCACACACAGCACACAGGGR